jgi:hypothetical protein
MRFSCKKSTDNPVVATRPKRKSKQVNYIEDKKYFMREFEIKCIVYNLVETNIRKIT